jgi:hypothetical protein
MKTALRLIVLILAAVIGLWAVGHGIALAATIRLLARERADILRDLIELSSRGAALLLAYPPQRRQPAVTGNFNLTIGAEIPRIDMRRLKPAARRDRD